MGSLWTQPGQHVVSSPPPPPRHHKLHHCGSNYSVGNHWEGFRRMHQTRGNTHVRVHGGHNVERVAEEGYDDCSGFKSDEAVEGPFEFKTSTAGTYYFVCGVGGHCKFGNQKAIVTVDNSC